MGIRLRVEQLCFVLPDSPETHILRGRAALLLRRRHEGGERMFIAHHELMLVLQVLVPTLIFVVLSIYIGIYISMALFICFFMMWHGRYPWYKSVPLSIAVPVVLFVVFEIWFLVPLPKGPFEAWLGY